MPKYTVMNFELIYLRIAGIGELSLGGIDCVHPGIFI